MIATSKRDALNKQGDTPTSSNERAVAISVNHISKTYPIPLARLKSFIRRSSKPPVEALRDVTLDVREGEIFGLIGPNGAGKTTLTKIIATLVQPSSGTVTVKGFDSVREEEEVRAQVGLATAEERSFYWRLTAEQNLLFFARLYGLSDAHARLRISELVKLLEIEELTRRRFGELSTGNKQRMAVARALLSEPPILLLDEPTRSLDPLAARRMRSLISQLARQTPPVSILLTSHNLSEVEELCERVAIISQGMIRAVDTPQNLRALHKQTERVHLNARGISRERAEQLLTQGFKDVETMQQKETADVTIAFTREAGDEHLDDALRLLHEEGARIVSCRTEQATLLDVLLSYESEEHVEGEESR
jgi:ABC-2 type transport system ATP-binding protein